MCGISGIYRLSRPVDPGELDAFTDVLAHRGPDGRGTFCDLNLGLGHRRLAILDLSSAGACPLHYTAPAGNRFSITYNGEVYNFLELRRELESLGHRFFSETDTEVIVAAFAQWGESSLLRFNGMWAFAIWDHEKRCLFLARDRFGIKPLYYAVRAGTLYFASELKAFLALTSFPVELNQELVPGIISSTYSYEGTTDETLIKHVKRLPAGHVLTMGADGRIEAKRWWETLDHLPEVPTTYEDQVEGFRTLFLDAVQIRMRSDVPVGTCLSGGIDSGSVASAMAWIHKNNPKNLERCPADWQQSFIATFPGTMLDEKYYADEIVKHTGARPHYWEFRSEEAVEHIIDSVWAMEDIYGGLAVPVWCIYREMRTSGVYVSLDGHGGDELLCGYTWYLNWLMQDVNQNLYNDFHFSLLPAILRNYDRCSMAHGIEVRMPLMDWRLVCYAFALAAESKIGEGYTKRILRDAMKGIMPESVRTRRSKIGFNSPMIEWFNSGMRPLIEKVIAHPYWQDSPFWDGKETGRYILSRTRSSSWSKSDWNETLHIWTRMNLVIWQMMFIEKMSIDQIKGNL